MKYRIFLCAGLFLSLLTRCDRQKKIPAFNPSYGEYIHAYTNGLVSKRSFITVHFNQEVKEKVTKNLLSFDPDIEGELQWIDSRRLQYIPSKDLIPGQVYLVKLQLDKLLEVPDSLSDFEFGFQVLKPDYEWGDIRLEADPANQMEMYTLKGSLLAADKEDISSLEEILTVKVEGKEYTPQWSSSDMPQKYQFRLEKLPRREKAYDIKIDINKNAPGTHRLDDRSLTMNALGDFSFLGYNSGAGQERTIDLMFSDPLDPAQDLNGLIAIDGVGDLRFEINNTIIKVFLPEVTGSKRLKIYPGIKNIKGKSSDKTIERTVHISDEKPQVEILGKGNIIPGRADLLLPFRTIGLNAVDVRVIRIPRYNALQFMQENDLGGNSELYRVGEVVAKKKIELGNSTAESHKWTTYSLDISKLIKPESGSIYKIFLSFSRDYSTYPCSGDTSAVEEDGNGYYSDYYYEYQSDDSPYNPDDYYFRYPRGYRWDQRDNPCHVSYYVEDRFASRTVLSSRLGIIAKAGDNGKVNVAVRNLLSARPISGATVSAYDYQQKPIASQKTDGEGWAVFKPLGKVFFLVVEKGDQMGYLKMENGHSLSLSNFDVEGTQVKKGLKGFLYGERGVWRPGDSLYLNFILQQAENELPEGYPVHFELYNPKGILVDKQLANDPTGRIYSFTTYTEPRSVTGNYRALVKVGDVEFEKRIRIEAVKPNRLDIDLSFGEKIKNISNGKLSGQLHVEWLTGVEATGIRAVVNARLAVADDPFPAYSRFNFSDPSRSFYVSEKTWFDGKLNSSGNANIDAEIGKFSQAPGILKGRFEVRAFEGGGDFSTEYFDVDLAPFSRFVGVKMPEAAPEDKFLTTGKEHTIQLRTLDYQGNPVDITGLDVKVYKVDWHWWYDSQRENLGKYVENEATYLYKEDQVSTVNGKGEYKLQVDYPAWGRFLIRICDGDGHCSGQLTWFDWPAGTSGSRPELSGASMLSFTTTKEEYSVGEDIVATIPVAKESQVLITVENGSEILQREWVRPQGKELTYSFKAEKNMAPNIYISAFLIQPHSQTANDRPIRLFGVVPVSVVDEKARVHPRIITTDVWKPGSRTKISISESEGKKMHYTLAVVDEGLLNITGFETPDPWNYFYAKEALGVRTWDMYDKVMGAFGGDISRSFAVGGDEALDRKGLNNQNRFKPVVRVLGPFALKAGKTAEHWISIPNYVGKLKAMVVAEAEDKTYGHAEKSISVRQPLMVLSTLPRVLSPNEEISLPVTVFAMEDRVKRVEVKVETSGNVSVAGAGVQRLSFSKPGEKVVDFKLRTPEKIGEASVRVVASSSGEKAYDETRLQLRIPHPPKSESSDFLLAPGKDTTISYQPLGVSGTNALTIEAYGIPPLRLDSRLRFLFAYPHGCAEQVVSRALPLLYLNDVMDLTENMKQQQKQNIAIAIRRISAQQLGSGGVLYWPESRLPDPYITSYSGQFMYLAKEKGYQVPESFLSKWRSYQRNAARSWSPSTNTKSGKCSNCLEQSYRLYTLAEEGNSEVGAMNRLKEVDNIDAASLWELAGAYALIGQDRVARELVIRASKTPAQSQYSHYYRSNLADKAIQLEVLHRLGREKESLSLARDIATALSSESWYSTYSVARALKAVLSVYGDLGKAKPQKWQYSGQNKSRSFSDTRLITQFTPDASPDSRFSYTLKNTGETPLNFSVTRTGTPLKDDSKAVDRNLRMRIEYTYPNGKPLDISSMRQGQDFIAQVTISREGPARSAYENMVLTQLFPGGWEILNTRLFSDGEGRETPADLSAPEYQDIRDDRVYTYFSLRNQNSVRFAIRLNATYAGRFYLPPTVAEDMYDPDIQSRSEGRWVEILR